MRNTLFAIGLLAHATVSSGQVVVSVPFSAPLNSSAQLTAAPVGVSLEFFAWPGYNGLPSTSQCLRNLHDLTGTWPPMRIGGTTQDRATYDASLSKAVSYSVSDPGTAPASLTFGPSFFSLAAEYGGKVVIGLNRRLNNLSNTIAAAKAAADTMQNIQAIELGNEPNFYSPSDPIAGGSWSANKDVNSQVLWQSTVSRAINKTDIFSAGVYFGHGSFSVENLAGKEATALSTVKDFCSHNYPQSAPDFNLTKLMSHSEIKNQLSPFAAEKSAASSAGKPYIMGETNSATNGGGGISPTFGAALWIVDYVMQSVLLGIESLYFHQGTIGNCQYCWWGKYSMGAPYYGAYFATMALAGATKVAPLDAGANNYAIYAIYGANNVERVLLINSDFYQGSGTRNTQTFVLANLRASTVNSKRLTAAAATSRQDQGQNPSVGGQTFVNGTCAIQGQALTESTAVQGGRAVFEVKASEALLIYV